MKPVTGVTLTLSLAVALALPIGLSAAAPRAESRAEAKDTAIPPRYVREAQRVLRDLGHQPGPADGIVGPKTKAALARYQRAEKIAVTGRLDSETMVRLDIQQRLFQGQARAR